jgi:hypothetical protein
VDQRLVPNVLDVLDHRLETTARVADLMRLSEQEVEALAELLMEHYKAWSPPSLGVDEVRGLIDLTGVRFTDWHPGMPVPRPPIARLLYLDSVAVEDPVSESVANLVGHGMGYSHRSLVQRELAALVGCFRDAQELLADGTLILVPASQVSSEGASNLDGLATAIARDRVRYDALWDSFCSQAAEEVTRVYAVHGGTADLSEHRLSDVAWSDGGVFPQRSGLATDVPLDSARPALAAHQNAPTRRALGTLSAATAACAYPIPGSIFAEATHRAMIAMALQLEPSGRASATRSVVSALASADLPLLADLPVDTLVRIRRDESAFAAWRAELRSAVRVIRETPSEPGFSLAARATIDDLLMPRVEELRRAATVRQRAVAGVRDATIAFGIGAASALTRGSASIAAGLTAAGAASAAGLAARALFPTRQPGANGVLLRLLPMLERPSGRAK